MKEYRRKRIGEKVFRFCVKQAKDKGCGRIEWTVYDWNESAIRFYKQFGAICLEKKYYRLDKKQIEDIKKRRGVLRQQRLKGKIPVISLVGYTNAGKSTLLNSLTEANQAVDDSLFTTLDPLSRLLIFPDNEKAVLTDTVGFIEDLPEQLIQAFMATLEEISYADLIVHIVDVSSAVWRRKLHIVEDILNRLGCDKNNKIVCLIYNWWFVV